ncbi:primosomal replication protein [Vibrio sp.]|nr:primosomal replication protein [Vibrio sp.]
MNQNDQALHRVLDALKQQAKGIDQRRGEHHLPLFDNKLFHCHYSRLLVPYVQEAEETLNNLLQVESGKVDYANHLSDRLLAQIGAIKKEVETQGIRKQTPKHYSYFRKPINQLYQEMAQHQEWERRLKEMVRDQEFTLKTAPQANHASMQRTLLATEQRLKRCQESKVKLEQQIQYREKNQ